MTLVVLAIAGATACGASHSRRAETAADVASLLRQTWGTTKGFPTFDYSCMRLDDRGRLFSCRARDRFDTVTLASFDVVCDASACTWTDYPTHIG